MSQLPARSWLLPFLLFIIPSAAEAQPFIRVEGARFMEGEAPFYFVGANLNVMHGPTARQEAASTIAAAAADQLKVGRIWALGESVQSAPAWKRRDFLFRAGSSGWQETAYRHLDRVIAEAGKRGLRLIITLANRWPDYGGVRMYLRWGGHVDVESYGYTDRFFADPNCRRWYVQHLRRLVGRTNSVTGVPYREDPTIMTWELMNEMGGTPEGAAWRRRWVKEMASEVRALDRNHLITPGLIGYDLKLERQNWLAMNRMPEVSYCDQHVYPEEHPRSRGQGNQALYIDDRVQLAHHVLGKPIVFGEFGFADKGSMKRRGKLHGQFLRRVFHDGGNGALVWIYQPTLSWKRSYGIMVDQGGHRVVRRTLAGAARRISKRAPANKNSALSPGRGSEPMGPTHFISLGRKRPHSRWRRNKGAPGRAVLSLPVDQFHRARFEESGTWAGGILVHAYGRRTGWFDYSFRGPGFQPATLTVRARLSSEFPGRAAPAGGWSRVRLLLDGREAATLRAAPDDGVGAWHTVKVADPKLLGRLSKGAHTLRFAVEQGPGANGVALYGREVPINREPVDSPGPITLEAARH